MKISKMAIALTAILGAMSGCADVENGDYENGSETDDDALAQRIPVSPAQPTQPSGGASKTVRDPKGTYFADVLAVGDGCPAGSWDVDISPDGKAFTLTFSKYTVSLQPDAARLRQTIDCTLDITLNSPSGLSFAVTNLRYQGYTFADRGVTTSAAAYYTFNGQRVTVGNNPIVRQTKRDYAGPYDASFLFEDKVRTQDLVFAECGRQRKLEVQTSLAVVKSKSNQKGYINLLSVDGETQGKVILELTSKPCTVP